MPPPEDIIRAYAQVARPILLDYLDRRSCIASAHAGVMALGLFGVTVKPVAVDFRLVVPALDVAYISGIDEESKAIAQAGAGGWLDLDAENSGWNGHIVLTWGSQLLIDPSFDQAFASIEAGGVQGLPTTPLTLVLPLMGGVFCPGTLAHYSMRTDPPTEHKVEVYYGGKEDDSYKATGAWQDEAIPLIVDRIAREMLKRLH